MRKITIAIDGYSSTGKSTLAKQLARKLHYLYVDSGAMYRAITLYAITNHYIGNGHHNIKALIAQLPHITLHFHPNEAGQAEIYVNNKNVAPHIRSLNVSNHVSTIASLSEVRQQLVAQQRQLGKNKEVVMDGRDIGTVVFPDAELKLFLTASPDIRAQRRYKELLHKGESITYSKVAANLHERDTIDSQRKNDPLRKAPDAILIDNSTMSMEEQFQYSYHLALRIITQTP